MAPIEMYRLSILKFYFKSVPKHMQFRFTNFRFTNLKNALLYRVALYIGFTKQVVSNMFLFVQTIRYYIGCFNSKNLLTTTSLKLRTSDKKRPKYREKTNKERRLSQKIQQLTLIPPCTIPIFLVKTVKDNPSLQVLFNTSFKFKLLVYF